MVERLRNRNIMISVLLFPFAWRGGGQPARNTLMYNTTCKVFDESLNLWQLCII
jgi:hypothetical protein